MPEDMCQHNHVPDEDKVKEDGQELMYECHRTGFGQGYDTGHEQ